MILLVDNRDSYTFNLAQLIAAVADSAPLVVPAEEVFAQRIPARIRAGEFSHLVISPGPGTPAELADFAGSRAALEAATEIPVLGVCLGHQGLGMLAGATVDRAPQARHGFVSRVTHSGDGMFANLPQDFAAVRYHSLHVRDIDEKTLRIHARSEDDVVMGLEVIGRPHWGVQFHPESILTEHGASLIRNFLALDSRAGTAEAKSKPGRWGSRLDRASHLLSSQHGEDAATVHIETLELAIDAEATFTRLQAGASAAFWLDSASRVGDSGRYSVLGTNRGSGAQTIRYRVGGQTEVLTGDRTELVEADIFEYLERGLPPHAEVTRSGEPIVGDDRVPFSDGYFGYFGYECKSLTVPGHQPRHRAEQADAYWIFPQAHLVIDHDHERVHLIVRDGADREALLEELRDAVRVGTRAAAADASSARVRPHHAQTGSTADPARSGVPGSWRLSDREYAARILEIKSALLRGDSYEVCLTDTFEADARVDGFELYQQLRRQNAAPYAAYFRFETFGDDLEILSASPERFLLAQPDRTVESKPIKGTAPRAADPAQDARIALDLQADPKTRAENLMIVDLLRNDLGRVCETGSVEVPALMQIESYATVHQLVSTIRGRLRADHTLIDLLRATFPGGSMTGAPKARTLEIIDQLEAGPRGIYSGTLGYLGRDGSADLNILIRTIVKSGRRLQLGAGGAIVLDSDAQAEIDEKDLKAAALIAAIARTVAGEKGTRDEGTRDDDCDGS
ncbi:aminodeoxychorismate synthase component I [Gulosibacter chungangensis]|uniref:aminodeoxychorismate synthase n=1 Tax=Gulosibacter chungangensis TaxID=979746 RepID=A0A7J5BD25_9MICO|nr:aminodeoxychorismate synthase component I [Gulosibacter chungangensis]KAB1643107.1 aminodeoxychorismate synthase component I [Gulosibacter chungangensis]